jgi:hypothetical protein
MSPPMTISQAFTSENQKPPTVTLFEAGRRLAQLSIAQFYRRADQAPARSAERGWLQSQAACPPRWPTPAAQATGGQVLKQQRLATARVVSPYVEIRRACCPSSRRPASSMSCERRPILDNQHRCHVRDQCRTKAWIS